MGVMQSIKRRKSVRAYDVKKPVTQNDLDQILEAARLAPSARNLQDWKFLVIKDKKMLKDLVPACKEQKFVAQADCVVVSCSDATDYIMTCGQQAYTVDISIAVTHMCLMAAELGIGSCWLGAFFENDVKKLLGVPDKFRVVALLTLGYPDGKDLSNVVTTTRKDLKEIVRYDKWDF